MFESKEFVTSQVQTDAYTLNGLIQKPIQGSLAQHLNDPEACFLTLIRANVVAPEASAASSLAGEVDSEHTPHYFSTMAVAKTQIHWLASAALSEKYGRQGNEAMPARRLIAVFGETCLVGSLRLRPSISLSKFLKHVHKGQQFQEMTDVTLYKCDLYEHMTGQLTQDACLEQFPAAVLNFARASLICEAEEKALSAA
ncbi:MAG: hypothetical protein AAF267_24280 [Deinococcota bacterium]